MPEPPGFLNRFQFIKSWFFNKCHSPWVLYLELAVQPTVEASHTLLMFDLGDVLRTVFRPHGTRTKRHGRKKPGKRGKKGELFPEPNDVFLDDLRDWEELPGRKVDDGVKMLWTIDSIGQKWLGRLMLLEVAEEWLYKWALLLNVRNGHDCGLAAAFGTGGGDLTQSGAVGTIGGCNAVWASGGADIQNGTVFVPADRWMCVLTCKLKNIGNVPFSPDPISVSIGIRNDDGTWFKGITQHKELDLGQETEVVVTAFFDQGESASLVWSTFQTHEGRSRGDITDVQMYAQAF
jgi:hypothetical protein